ncbi:TIGR02302 family protein [Faunimonas pinastri]|nr:TIGR02302 family protein [Faunimonas pinastri]
MEAHVARLKGAVRRAHAALLWERIWPLLVPVLWLAGLFVALSWLGLWRATGPLVRLSVLAVFAILILASLARFLRLRQPTRDEALRRVEVRSGLEHRPASGLEDRLSPVAADTFAQALWAAHRQRLLAAMPRLSAGRPEPRLAERDPLAVRFAVPLLLALGLFVGWGEWGTRLREGFDPVSLGLLPPPARVDAWIDPPPYTHQPPVFLTRAGETATDRPVVVPQGSKLTVRVVSSRTPDVTLETGGKPVILPAAGNDADAQPTSDNRSTADNPIRTYSSALDKNSTIHIAARGTDVRYPLSVLPDHPPTIAWDPAHPVKPDSTELNFRVADDYGVTGGSVSIHPVDAAPGAHPLVDPPRIDLRLERPDLRDGTARASLRIGDHPFGGMRVSLDPVVRDGAGQEGRPSEKREITLPARSFQNPLARALVEQRQILAADANARDRVTQALDALMIAPERFTPDAGTYIGLSALYRQVMDARSDDDLREGLDAMWALALSVENGEAADAAQKLKQAQDGLQKALENGASQEEIAKLTQQLKQAMNEYLQAFAQEQAKRGIKPQQASPDTRMMSQDDLNKMLDQMQQLAQQGNRDAAQQMLSELQQMLDNLQMAQGQQGQGQQGQGQQSQAMEQMNQLGRIMRDQQKLMDQTYKLDQQQQNADNGQDFGDNAQQGQQGQQGDAQAGQQMQQLQNQQAQLQQELQKLLGQMGQQGKSPDQQGEGQQDQGQQGEGQQQAQQGQGQQGDGGRAALGRAGRAMGDATQSLQGQQPGDATGHQGDALQAMRQGLQGMMQQMQAQQGQSGQRGQAQGRQPGQGTATGSPGQRAADGQTDPLGRSRNQGQDFGSSVKVPQEIDAERVRQILNAIRERLGDRTRSQLELDYLERLLRPE